MERHERRLAAHRRRIRRRRLGALLVLALVVGMPAVWLATRGVGQATPGPASVATARSASTGGARTSVRAAATGTRGIVARRLPALSGPVSGAAGATISGGALVAGGLTTGDTSVATISLVSGSGARTVGKLPVALHDAAAASIGGAVYVFGGGNATGQLDGIVEISAGGTRARRVGRLPAGASDVAAATIGGTAYVVGGYTGTRWLDTIVAWRPGGPARVVGRLPAPLRYAAVAAAGGKLVIAGGSLASGAASADVLVFDPATGRVARRARLPRATTHAAAAALGGRVHVIGGRDGAGRPVASVVAFDPGSSSLQSAGRLPQALSDVAAIELPGRIVVAGGRSSSGPTTTVTELRTSARPATAAATRTIAADSAASSVYAHTAAGMLSVEARRARTLVYVPNSISDTVSAIDPRSYRVVGSFPVGREPQHVTPSYDMKTLYALSDIANTVTPIDPRTGKPRPAVAVEDPYNMYFTADGRYAIAVAERMARLDFRDPRTMRLQRSLPVDCRGVDHMDFSRDGRFAIASCEFSSELLKIDLAGKRVVSKITVGRGAGRPQDVRLAPNGRLFYVADMNAGGAWKVTLNPFRVTGFLATGSGAHGVYPNRDARRLYITNRGAGSITVVDAASGKIVGLWRIPGGGSPDMGGLSVDGRFLWLTGRYHGEVYVIDTRNGRLRARIKVGQGPHGLLFWPQPGRYSLGHTGNMR